MAETSIARATDNQRPCPQCAAPPDPNRPPVRVVRRGIVDVFLICSEGHGWAMRWVEAS